MSPKDKAIELVEIYENLDIDNNDSGIGGFYTKMSHDDAKDCAIICIKEILNVVDCGDFGSRIIDYYEKVKHEIEKL